MADPDIVNLQAADIDRLASLLQANGLPSEDIAFDKQLYIGLFDGSDLIAAGGLEGAGDCVLLRSLVVDQAHRGKGLASSITRELIERAEQEGYAALYLLTETAEAFFHRFNFDPVARAEVPEAIARTQQFASLCPDNAACLRLSLIPD